MGGTMVAWSFEVAAKRSVTWTAPAVNSGPVALTMAFAAGHGPVSLYDIAVAEASPQNDLLGIRVRGPTLDTTVGPTASAPGIEVDPTLQGAAAHIAPSASSRSTTEAPSADGTP